MENEESNVEEPKRVVAEFEILMHCDACERSVAKAIFKVEGVEMFTTDMNQNKVTITGQIDSRKVIKKVKKKTGKRAEVLDIREEKAEEDDLDGGNLDSEEMMRSPLMDTQGWERDCKANEHSLTTMFSDENPNACMVM